jgi:hypothetical protein
MNSGQIIRSLIFFIILIFAISMGTFLISWPAFKTSSSINDELCFIKVE